MRFGNIDQAPEFRQGDARQTQTFGAECWRGEMLLRVVHRRRHAFDSDAGDGIFIQLRQRFFFEAQQQIGLAVGQRHNLPLRGEIESLVASFLTQQRRIGDHGRLQRAQLFQQRNHIRFLSVFFILLVVLSFFLIAA